MVMVSVLHGQPDFGCGDTISIHEIQMIYGFTNLEPSFWICKAFEMLGLWQCSYNNTAMCDKVAPQKMEGTATVIVYMFSHLSCNWRLVLLVGFGRVLDVSYLQ